MRYWFFFIMLFLNATSVVAQKYALKSIDSLYKEDQFYAGVTYNLLNKKPKSLNQTGFSLGFHVGFIKDMPINLKRNVAIGVGLGYATSAYNQNLFINQNTAGVFEYNTLSGGQSFTRNTFSNHVIEIPIEFRWRTSTPQNYAFWRVYTGFKLGYLLANSSKYEGDLGRVQLTNNPDFTALQYGLTLSAGYNTWNLYLYYALNPVFSQKVTLANKPLHINVIKIGLIFYIL